MKAQLEKATPKQMKDSKSEKSDREGVKQQEAEKG